MAAASRTGRGECQASAYCSLSALISSMKESNGCQSSTKLAARSVPKSNSDSPAAALAGGLPPKKWSTVIVSKRRIRNGEQTSQTRRNSDEVAAG